MPGVPGGADCEGIVHQVTREPIPEQRPFPAGEHTIELSWSRTRAVMRLRLSLCPDHPHDDYEWYVKEMNGKVEIVGANKFNGRLTFRAKTKIIPNDGHPRAQFWKPKVSYMGSP